MRRALVLCVGLVAACEPRSGPRLAALSGAEVDRERPTTVLMLTLEAGRVHELVAELEGPHQADALVYAVDAPDHLSWDPFAWRGTLDLTERTEQVAFELVVHAEGHPVWLARGYAVQIAVDTRDDTP